MNALSIRQTARSAVLGTAACMLFFASALAQSDPLPSWNDTAPKKAIVAFVGKVTKEGSPEFVPAPERIAVFDNDGTLWVEHPMYTQLAFALDRVKAMAPMHPEWQGKQPFQAVLDGDMAALAAAGERGLVELVLVTHAGMTVNEFADIVMNWLATARHPRFQRPYTELVYQPMLELLSYFRANGFSTFIVSGGGIEFMRPWTERVYGIPPEQVVGSSGVTKYVMRAPDKPVLVKEAKVEFIDNFAGKAEGINQFIGRRPYLAFGNSDGDQQMLEWTMSGEGARFAGLVHHTDGAREWAYDRDSKIGKLDKALDEATAKDWLVVDMKQDWKVIYPAEKQ